MECSINFSLDFFQGEELDEWMDEFVKSQKIFIAIFHQFGIKNMIR